MPLIKSISGIRGTIGDLSGENLTRADIEKFTAAYGSFLLKGKKKNMGCKVVIGRDGRTSGEMVRQIVVDSLLRLGIDIIDLGLSTTPTVEIAVKQEKADGGIILTASHNPEEWNALKLLDNEGEFISAEAGNEVLAIAAAGKFEFVKGENIARLSVDTSYLQKHIDGVLQYPLVNAVEIKDRNFKIVIDAINSTGAIFVPALLRALGVESITVINGEVNGKFSHNPEPLPENLTQLSQEVVKQKADLGIAVDPDVDRLCFVCEDGSMFGEEYTLVAVADYVLGRRTGNAVSNMSSTKALKEITLKHGGQYFPSAVGEVNVVKKMKEARAVIGGEGNGGIIVPDFHYGRDALIGIGLFLSHLATHKKGIKSLRSRYPDYFIAKKKMEIPKELSGNNGAAIEIIFSRLKERYNKYPINTEDGLKIEFDQDWVHLRASNTEPVIRIYAESNFETTANRIALRLMADINEFTPAR